MGLEVWFEMRKVIDGALSMCRCNNMLWVLPDFTGDLIPSSFDGCDGVCEGTILCRNVSYNGNA